jgi:aromatic-L-amino-acid/L-tryptophan decarboxylase
MGSQTDGQQDGGWARSLARAAGAPGSSQPGSPMFAYDAQLADLILAYARQRLSMDPIPIGRGASSRPDAEALGRLLTADGTEPEVVLDAFFDQVVPSSIPADSPDYLAFIAQAPTPAARLFDMLVSSASMSASHWFEAAGAVTAENQTLRLLADLAGLPPQAGGCFVSGGSAANLSALIVAREQSGERGRRARIAVSSEAHASVALALKVIAVDALVVQADDHRLTGAALESALAADPDPGDVIGVVATAGTTNAGIIDDLSGIAEVARARGLWLHVDGAYGAAALFVPDYRALFAGIEHADSLVIDPHKWLFAPYDCGALIYREPELARRALTQRASYLDTLTDTDGWNPADYAFHLTRRPRGLALWFSLAVHGTDAYRDAIATGLRTAGACADLIDGLPHLELVRRPELTVVLFRRDGWGVDDYEAWSRRLFAAQIAFVAPTTWEGEPTARLAFLHPSTSIESVQTILTAMA